MIVISIFRRGRRDHNRDRNRDRSDERGGELERARRRHEEEEEDYEKPRRPSGRQLMLSYSIVIFCKSSWCASYSYIPKFMP